MMEERGKGPHGGKSVQDWLRMAKALGNQIDDPEAVEQALRVLAEFEAQIRAGINRLQTQDGYSWTELAAPTGISRQGMRQRWGATKGEPKGVHG